MICIYKQDNNNYTNNGDAVLIPTVCDLAMTINGAWQLKIEHPYDPEERYKLITEGAIIRIELECIAELETVYQLFRVYQYTKGLHSIEAIAFPVAMESTYDAPIDNLVISSKTGAQAMAQLQTFTNKYTLSSDVTATGSSSYNNTNINEAIASGNDNSFIQVWGGEILYDNYKFKVKTRLGDDTAGDHRVMYGRNLTNIEYEKDDSGIITRISPISQDNIRLDGTGYVDSSHISDYPVAHHKYETAPYTLVDTEATSPSQTAALTRQAVAAVSAQADTLSHSAWTTASGAGYQPEYIKSIKTEITEAVQNMALANVVSTSLYNLMKTTIANAMAWLGDLKQPKWEWMGSDQTGWKYGNATSYAKNMYVKIGKTWSYFGSDGNWQEPKDDSEEWDWHDVKNGTGKKYGNFNKYFAHNEYVYITQSGTIKEYWFNEQGWFEEDESGDSEYYWHGSGTGADPYWFGKDSSTYLKSCWRFIDGTYYFFDSYGYVAAQKDNYQWDWVESGDASRAWFGNAINSEYGSEGSCLKSQWEKINGTWYYFNSDGIVQSEAVSQTNAIAVFTTGMSGLTTTVDNWKGQLYSLLYSLMRSYCTWRFKQKIDLPAITIKVDMADLSKTEEYKDFADLEKIRLGDSVECIDYEHNISTTNRVIGITYDCILKSNKDITIGEAAATVAQMVGNAQGEAVTGGFDTSALETQLTALRNGKQDKLTAGDNITIENNIISASFSGAGKATVYYGVGKPSDSLGRDGDVYAQVSPNYEGLKTLSYMTSRELDYRDITSEAGIYTIKAGWYVDRYEHAFLGYSIGGLQSGKEYTVSFSVKQKGFYDVAYASELYGLAIQSNTDWMTMSDSPRDGAFEHRTVEGVEMYVQSFKPNKKIQNYEFKFTASSTNTLWLYPDAIHNDTYVEYEIFDLYISDGTVGNDIENLYIKVEDEWLPYEAGLRWWVETPQTISKAETNGTETGWTCTERYKRTSVDMVMVDNSTTRGWSYSDGGKPFAIVTCQFGDSGAEWIGVICMTTTNPIFGARTRTIGGKTFYYWGWDGMLPISNGARWANNDGVIEIGYHGTYEECVDYALGLFDIHVTQEVLDDAGISIDDVTFYGGRRYSEGDQFPFEVDNRGNIHANSIDTIEANPSGTASATLEKLTVNGTVYEVGGSGTQEQADWAQTDSTAVDYIKNKPTLATVATSGDYDDLTDKPSIPTKTSDLTNDSNFVSDANYVHTDNNFTTSEKTKLAGIESGAEANVQANWNETDNTSDAYIQNKPNLATVATSGAYSDLSGTPSLATVATSGSYNDLSNKPTIPTVEANPSGTASATLSTLEVDGTIYNVPSGGGSDLPLTVENGKLCIIYET